MLAGVTCAHAPESTAHGICAHTNFCPMLLIFAEVSCMLVMELIPEWRKSGTLASNPMASSMILSISCRAMLRLALHVLRECCPKAHSGSHPGSLDLSTLSFSFVIASSRVVLYPQGLSQLAAVLNSEHITVAHHPSTCNHLSIALISQCLVRNCLSS